MSGLKALRRDISKIRDVLQKGVPSPRTIRDLRSRLEKHSLYIEEDGESYEVECRIAPKSNAGRPRYKGTFEQLMNGECKIRDVKLQDLQKGLRERGIKPKSRRGEVVEQLSEILGGIDELSNSSSYGGE